ncbi:MAG: phospho-N-acetylmuramoyl-pentapeptide-transferase [Planctomycetaceae bacterium]
MLIWLMHRFAPLWEQMELFSTGDSRVFLTARIALASVTSYLLAMFFGPRAIRWLRRRFPERIDSGSETLNELQKDKQSTPTMGGLFIVASLVVAVLLWGDLTSPYVLLGLFVAISFAALGAVDDWIKLSTRHNGLKARTKLLVQSVLALLAGAALYRVNGDKPHGLELIWPFGDAGLWLGAGFVVWCVPVMVGSSNAVNLTDGLDGLAGGCTIFAGSAFVALCYLAGHAVMADYVSIPYISGAGELGVVLGALVGAMMGFLWFNCYPAQVFMGDTGALTIGALLGLGALVSRQEFLLVICGGVFVLETLSVVAQVGWFQLTGKRLIACSPLHNHYLFQGQHEMKIVVRFWIGSALLAIVGIASLKVR